MRLFQDQPDFERLKEIIVSQFRGRAVAVDEDLAQFVVADTPFLKTHFKIHILKPMELAGELSVVRAKASRKRGTFPEGTVIRIH